MSHKLEVVKLKQKLVKGIRQMCPKEVISTDVKREQSEKQEEG